MRRHQTAPRTKRSSNPFLLLHLSFVANQLVERSQAELVPFYFRAQSPRQDQADLAAKLPKFVTGQPGEIILFHIRTHIDSYQLLHFSSGT